MTDVLKQRWRAWPDGDIHAEGPDGDTEIASGLKPDLAAHIVNLHNKSLEDEDERGR